MQRSKAAPPGARVPLLVLAVALAAGVVIFLRVHAHLTAARTSPSGARSIAVVPAHGSDAHEQATR